MFQFTVCTSWFARPWVMDASCRFEVSGPCSRTFGSQKYVYNVPLACLTFRQQRVAGCQGGCLMDCWLLQRPTVTHDLGNAGTCFWATGGSLKPGHLKMAFDRRRTNVQQLTCNINLPKSFYYLLFSFVLIELKPFVLKGKVLGEKFWKSAKNSEKVWKIMRRFCPLVVAL